MVFSLLYHIKLALDTLKRGFYSSTGMVRNVKLFCKIALSRSKSNEAYNIFKLLRGENKSAVMFWILFDVKILQRRKKKNTLERKREHGIWYT